MRSVKGVKAGHYLGGGHESELQHPEFRVFDERSIGNLVFILLVRKVGSKLLQSREHLTHKRSSLLRECLSHFCEGVNERGDRSSVLLENASSIEFAFRGLKQSDSD